MSFKDFHSNSSFLPQKSISDILPCILYISSISKRRTINVIFPQKELSIDKRHEEESELKVLQLPTETTAT